MIHRSDRQFGDEAAIEPSGSEASQSTAERLVEVAGRIFAAKGSDATVREICKEAGCSVAAVNYYFGDKNQLYQHCVQTACERKQKLFPLPDVREVTADEAPAALRSFLQAIASRIAASAEPSDSSLAWQNTLMMREVLSPASGVMEMLKKPFAKDFMMLEQLVAKLLGEELNATEIREELLTQILSRCMFLKTGKNLRKMLSLDSNSNEDPQIYANRLCDSILLQIQALKASSPSMSADWPDQENSTKESVPTD